MPIFTVRADSGRYTDAFQRGGYAGIGWFDTLLDDTSTREAIGAHYRGNFLGQSVGTAGWGTSTKPFVPAGARTTSTRRPIRALVAGISPEHLQLRYPRFGLG